MKQGTDLSTAFLQFRERFGVPGSVLKYIAIITMFIDHTGASVVRSLRQYSSVMSNPTAAVWVPKIYYIMRRTGRLAFPIFCFLLVEGFVHTRNIQGYVKRMFLFALLSEFPFDFCLHYSDLRNAFHASSVSTFLHYILNKQNVYFTLLIGLLVLWGIRLYMGKIAIQLVIMVAGMMLANYLHTDYSYKGVFIIEILYIMRHLPIWQGLCGASFSSTRRCRRLSPLFRFLCTTEKEAARSNSFSICSTLRTSYCLASLHRCCCPGCWPDAVHIAVSDRSRIFRQSPILNHDPILRRSSCSTAVTAPSRQSPITWAATFFTSSRAFETA